jgi:hypothetical protein
VSTSIATLPDSSSSTGAAFVVKFSPDGKF